MPRVKYLLDQEKRKLISELDLQDWDVLREEAYKLF